MHAQTGRMPKLGLEKDAHVFVRQTFQIENCVIRMRASAIHRAELLRHPLAVDSPRCNLVEFFVVVVLRPCRRLIEVGATEVFPRRLNAEFCSRPHHSHNSALN
jgi:hypothetical protein